MKLGICILYEFCREREHSTGNCEKTEKANKKIDVKSDLSMTGVTTYLAGVTGSIATDLAGIAVLVD